MNFRFVRAGTALLLLLMMFGSLLGVIPPAHADEQGGSRASRGARDQRRTPPHEVRLERGARVAADRHDAVRATLADEPQPVDGDVVGDEPVTHERRGRALGGRGHAPRV